MAQLMMQKIVNRCAHVKARSKDMIMVCAMCIAHVLYNALSFQSLCKIIT